MQSKKRYDDSQLSKMSRHVKMTNIGLTSFHHFVIRDLISVVGKLKNDQGLKCCLLFDEMENPIFFTKLVIPFFISSLPWQSK